MDRSAIEKIVELGAPNIHMEGGYTYSDKELKVIQEPKVRTLPFRTLSGLVYALLAEHENFAAPLLVSEAVVRKLCAVFLRDSSKKLHKFKKLRGLDKL